MGELKGCFVTESELRTETVTLGNNLYAEIRGITKKLDDMAKVQNRPNEFITLEDVSAKLNNYTTKRDVENMIM